MYDPYDDIDERPTAIAAFEIVWFLAMVVSLVVAVLMFDYSVTIVGPYPAALVNIVLFGLSAVLMFRVSRGAVAWRDGSWPSRSTP